jgi:hypothetical protein
MERATKLGLLLGMIAAGTACGAEQQPLAEEHQAAPKASAYVDFNESECTEAQVNQLNQAITLAADNAMLAEMNYWYGPHAWLGDISDLAYSRILGVSAYYNTDTPLPFRCDSVASPTGSCPGFLARAQDKIRICADFWNLPLYLEASPGVPPSQRASQVSTLLHEAAHFAGAWEDEYDDTKAWDLAQRDADAAAENGPNFEYHYIEEVFGHPQLFWWQ